MTPALVLAGLSAGVAALAAYLAWRARRVVRDLAAHHETLTTRYAGAIAVIVLVARADPPVAHPQVIALCERILAEHQIEQATVTTGRVH